MTVRIEEIKRERTASGRIVHAVFQGFLRIMACVFFALALYSWLSAIGYWPGDNFRFDTMAAPMKVYIAVLAVLQPVASVGLWTTMPWGRVVWFLAIAFQMLAIFRFPDLVHHAGLLFVLHAATIALYVSLTIVLTIVDKEA